MYRELLASKAPKVILSVISYLIPKIIVSEIDSNRSVELYTYITFHHVRSSVIRGLRVYFNFKVINIIY